MYSSTKMMDGTGYAIYGFINSLIRPTPTSHGLLCTLLQKRVLLCGNELVEILKYNGLVRNGLPATQE